MEYTSAVKNVSDKKIQQFFSRFPVKTYQKNQVILGGGEAFSTVMYITSGFVRQYILSAKGDEQTTTIYGPKDIFSLVWAITGKERQYRYFEAMTMVTVYQCPRKKFVDFLKTDPSTSFSVLEQTLTRVDDMLQRIAYIAIAKNAQVKIYVFFVLLCQRFAYKGRKHMLPFRLMHKDIAGMLGLSRETVSIAVKKLTDDHILFCEDHFFGVNLYKHVSLDQKELHDLLKV